MSDFFEELKESIDELYAIDDMPPRQPVYFASSQKEYDLACEMYGKYGVLVLLQKPLNEKSMVGYKFKGKKITRSDL